MLYDVVAVKARDPFRIWIRFEDGTEGEADLSDLAGRGVFKRWIDNPSEFVQATVDPGSGTVVWPGGLDVAPDRLYEEVVHAQASARRSRPGRSPTRSSPRRTPGKG
jgi:hypothetical protein